MEKRKIKGTMMVLNGVPYSLYKYDRWSILNPCNCCDLSPICLEEDKDPRLIDLCTPDPRDEGCFFQKDWKTMDQRLREEIDFSKEEF